jgi:hypothetical protein
MFLMFALFVVSLCTLLWAAISVGRHVRRDKREQQSLGFTASAGVGAGEVRDLGDGQVAAEAIAVDAGSLDAGELEPGKLEPEKLDSNKLEPAQPLGPVGE